MLFRDRQEAGEQLAAKLTSYSGKQALLLAVPRGGVSVAEPLRGALGAELDLIITRKIGAPAQSELAIGAVSSDGFIMRNEKLVARLGVTEEYINHAALREEEEIKRRLVLYRGDRPLPVIDERIVIVIDDGVATGYTILAALRSVRRHNPARLVLALPVGPPDTLALLREEVDELVCLDAPADFRAVGQFYLDFSQVSDHEVRTIMGTA